MIERVLEVLSGGKNVVLEFILYEDPPRPLLRYHEALAAQEIHFTTTILRPNVEEVLRRIHSRGRANDRGRPGLRARAEHQVRVLVSRYIEPGWLIDTTHLTVEDVYESYFKRGVEE
jgi:hypothetical protein